MIAVASGAGYADYLTREAAKDERLGWGLAFQLTKLRLLYSILFIAVGLGVLWLLGYSRSLLISVGVLSLSLFPRALTEHVQGILRGLRHYLLSFLIELSLGVTLILGAALLSVKGGGVTIVIATELAAAVVAALLVFALAANLRPARTRTIALSQLIKTSAVFNIYAFVGNLYDRLDVVILSKLAGDYATGIYGAAYRPIATLQLLPYGILYSLLPGFARSGYTEEERARFERAMGLLLSIALLIVLATYTYAANVVPIVFGSRFAESATVFEVLIWAIALRYLNYGLNIALLAVGRERVFVVTSLMCLGVNVVGNLALVPLFSWRAAAGLTIATEAVLFTQNIYWLRRTLKNVPVPFGWARTCLVFVCLFAITIMGVKIMPTPAIGTVCLVSFLIYLHRAGMLSEFAAVWRGRQAAPAEVL